MCSSRAQVIFSGVCSPASMRRQSSRFHSTVRSPVVWSIRMYAVWFGQFAPDFDVVQVDAGLAQALDLDRARAHRRRRCRYISLGAPASRRSPGRSPPARPGLRISRSNGTLPRVSRESAAGESACRSRSDRRRPRRTEGTIPATFSPAASSTDRWCGRALRDPCPPASASSPARRIRAIRRASRVLDISPGSGAVPRWHRWPGTW